MDNFYLYDYLIHGLNFEPDLLESLRYELDQLVYYYGEQFKYPKEKTILKKPQEGFFKRILKTAFYFYQILSKKAEISSNSNIIISNAYFKLNEELKNSGFSVFRPPWALNWSLSERDIVLYDRNLVNVTNSLKLAFLNRNFRELITPEFIGEIKNYRQKLRTFYEKPTVKAIFVPNDMSFFENLSIKIFKEIDKPSFIFLHGLPGRYNILDDNRSKYLIVWGEKIKQHYVQTGFKPDKIFVSGHPYYKDFKRTDLRFSFEDILIITKSMNGAQHSDKVRLADRGNLILYLYSIQKVLKEFGIKSVRFRPHPSENPDWYFRFLDPHFFKLDSETLQNSLTHSTLVIGPTSTVFLEALYYGADYLVYDPICENVDLINFPLVPPFDGSDRKVPVAKNEEEFRNLLQGKKTVDPSIFKDYIKTPFDLNFIKDMV